MKLADFGASKKIEELASVGHGDGSVGTKAMSIKGTPYWMAPEIIKQVSRCWAMQGTDDTNRCQAQRILLGLGLSTAEHAGCAGAATISMTYCRAQLAVHSCKAYHGAPAMAQLHSAQAYHNS